MASSGNFNTWNPLTTKGFINFALGNTSATMNTNYVAVDGTLAARTGKYYWEMNYAADGNFSDGRLFTGIHAISNTVSGGAPYNASDGTNQFYPDPNIGLFVVSHRNASGRGNANIGGSGTTLGSSFINVGLKVSSANTIIMCAMDLDNYIIYWGINGNWKGLANSSDTSSSTDITAVTGVSIPSAFRGFHFSPAAFFSGATSGTTVIINAGQDSTFSGTITSGSANASDSNSVGNFYYTPPTNFLALSSFALPISDDIDPAQTDDDYPSKQFGVVTYTGNASTNNITGLNFKPDLVWIKIRNTASNAVLVDSSRGTNKMLHPNNTNAEVTTANLTSFNSDGFSLDGTSDYQANYNGNGNTYVAWCWRANGGTTASNSDGSITTTLQVGKGFSIGTYTGTGSNATVGHGLGAIPDFTIFRERGSSGNWAVTSQKNMSSNDHNLYLQTSQAQSDGNYFQNTAMTSSVISIGTHADINGSSNTYVMYNWINVEGYQRFGKYTGNGSTDGPFVYLGFRPRMLFIKRLDSAANWQVRDTARRTFNVHNVTLNWDSDTSETQNSNHNMDILSNGFKLRTTLGDYNASGGTYVFGSWSDVPFKYNNTF